MILCSFIVMRIYMGDRLFLFGERWVNPLPDQKKKTHFVGLFFLTGLRPVLRLRRSTPSARCAFGAPPPNWIALALRPMSRARLDRRCNAPIHV